jgi:hypothetical protein
MGVTHMLHRNRYRRETIDSWDELLKWYQFLSKTPGGQGKGWIFRGEKSVKFDLTTSLERAAKISGHNLKMVPALENKLLREFKRRLHHYTNDLPEKNDRLEWLALMQHYGAPTRLLDWTYSFFVAAYFAIEVAELPRCVVWGLNMNSYKVEGILSRTDWSQIEQRYEKYAKVDHSIRDKPWIKQSAIIDYLAEHPKPLVLSVNPFRLNERLTIQQGAFIFPGDISKSFEDNLTAHSVSSNSLIRFEISSKVKVRKEILLNLHRMNMSRASLFPGLEGFAESLKTRLAFPELLSGHNDIAWIDL